MKDYCIKHKLFHHGKSCCWRCEQEALGGEHLIEAVTNSLDPHDILTCDLKDGEFTNGRRV